MELSNTEKIVGLIVSISTAVLSWVKWGTSNDNPIQSAAKGNTEINEVINRLIKEVAPIKIVSVAEITNGGGIPEIGKPLYIRNLFSTDIDTLKMFSEKYLIDRDFTKIVNQTILTGDCYFTKNDVADSNVKIWFDANDIKKCHWFLVSVDKGTRVIVLIINKDQMELLDVKDFYKVITTANEIKKIIHKPTFFQRIFKKK